MDGARLTDIDHLKWLGESDLCQFAKINFLDVGCGSGFLCQEAAKAGARLSVGIDLLKPDVSQDGWTYLPADLENPVWCGEAAETAENSGYDLVTAFDILEHLTAPFLFLNQCRSLLKKDGILVVTTPNTNSWERLLHPNAWSGVQDLQHKTLFSRYSLRFLLQRTGFELLIMKSPVRKLMFLRKMCPNIGAQIFCVSRRRV